MPKNPDSEGTTRGKDAVQTYLGAVEDRRGTLYFARSDQKKPFEFDLLSSGEKEVVDLLLDLYLRQDVYNDTVFLIDEPELHVSTSIQRKLLPEVDRLVGADCQIWLATHSIGLLRALQDDLVADCQVIDFGKASDLGSATCRLEPMRKTRANWKAVFKTALDNLAGLICPKRLVYCEGKAESPAGEEKGLDANVYNTVFGETHSETLFVSSGGNTEPAQASELGISILSKIFADVEILVLVDRDTSRSWSWSTGSRPARRPARTTGRCTLRTIHATTGSCRDGRSKTISMIATSLISTAGATASPLTSRPTDRSSGTFETTM